MAYVNISLLLMATETYFNLLVPEHQYKFCKPVCFVLISVIGRSYLFTICTLISARYHTFVEIDHEIISTVILLPSADLFKKGCGQLQAKVCAQITG